MKFSFDARNYRDNLAKDLVEKRKESREDAKQFLDEEKTVDRYLFSEDIKNLSTEIEKEKKEVKSDEIERRDVDDNFEIQTFDISDRIPKDIQIYFDKIRLQKIQKELTDFPVKNDYREFHKTTTHADGKRDLLLSKLNKETQHKFEMRESEIVNKMRDYDYQIRDEARNFIDELTDGAFYNPNMLSHVVEGNSKHPALKSENRFPHVNKDSNTLQEKSFEIDNVSLDELWYTAGGSDQYIFDPTKVIVICDSNGKRIRESLYDLHGYGDSNKQDWAKTKSELPMKERFEKAMDVARKSHIGGICITFDTEKTWEEIADWIVDLYHGKLYKIVEKSKEATSSTNESGFHKNLESNCISLDNLPIAGIDIGKLSDLEKTQNPSGLTGFMTKEDIDFMHLRGPEFESADFEKDFNDKIAQETINKKQEFAEIFNCQIDQIALSKEEIDEHTIVFGGEYVSLDDESIKTCNNLKFVTGGLSVLTKNESYDFLKELCYVGKDLYFNSDKINLKKLERVGGKLSIEGGMNGSFPTNLKYIGGNLDAREYQGKLPKNIKDIVNGRIRWSIKNFDEGI